MPIGEGWCMDVGCDSTCSRSKRARIAYAVPSRSSMHATDELCTDTSGHGRSDGAAGVAPWSAALLESLRRHGNRASGCSKNAKTCTTPAPLRSVSWCNDRLCPPKEEFVMILEKGDSHDFLLPSEEVGRRPDEGRLCSRIGYTNYHQRSWALVRDAET